MTDQDMIQEVKGMIDFQNWLRNKGGQNDNLDMQQVQDEKCECIVRMQFMRAN